MNPSLRSRVLREWRPYAPPPGLQPAAASAAQLVPQVMNRLGLVQRLQQSQVFHQWTTIVGAAIAKHAQPVGLKKGLLTVNVDHPIWLQELARYHKPMLLQKIHAAVGKAAVRDLIFRIG